MPFAKTTPNAGYAQPEAKSEGELNSSKRDSVRLVPAAAIKVKRYLGHWSLTIAPNRLKR
jgi:hypothetical protein